VEYSHSESRQSPPPKNEVRRSRVLGSLGLGLITGAADDNPSAIGTYASAGAQFGLSLLWTPVNFPMMFAVVYLSSKLGQVAGQGLFHVLRNNYMKALVVAGIVQGFSRPPLLLLILLMTNNRRIMGDRKNTLAMNILGGITRPPQSLLRVWA
jgi:Mn2+/Fe2+ NRAMP family transporter